MNKVKQITVKSREQWRKWLQENHLSEERIFLISYKRHTGKDYINHRAQLEEALCFGWIDTTVKRLSEDQYGRFFVKRKDSANWSKNTLEYAKRLLKEGQMSAFGKKVYLKGLKKKPMDHDMPDKLEVPKDLRQNLLKNKRAKAGFKSYSPSTQKACLMWLFRAKRQETRDKRIQQIVTAASIGEKVW